MNTILPIGSVVKLKGIETPVMIFGYLQQTSLKPDIVYDYIGVPYPAGNVSINQQAGFQMTDITEVLFEGYKAEEFNSIAVLLALRQAGRSKTEETV